MNQNIKIIKRKRSENNWKKSETGELGESIETSWKPSVRTEKPPYSYATIIGHAILSSKERKMTLHDIYIWISKNYPYYSSTTQGWQNSIRHNLSLHKSFVKIDRDQSNQNPPRKGCYWTIKSGKEKHFIDNLQKPSNQVRKQHSLSTTRPLSISNKNNHHKFSLTKVIDIKKEDSDSLNDVINSTIESSTNSSPILLNQDQDYQELFSNLPETYNVYPEHIELFGDQNQLYYIDSSPSDGYSTTSSFTDTIMNFNNSPDPYLSSDHSNFIDWNHDQFLSPFKQQDYCTPSNFFNENIMDNSTYQFNSFCS